MKIKLFSYCKVQIKPLLKFVCIKLLALCSVNIQGYVKLQIKYKPSSKAQFGPCVFKICKFHSKYIFY